MGVDKERLDVFLQDHSTVPHSLLQSFLQEVQQLLPHYGMRSTVEH